MEGPTDEATIVELRRRQRRNLLLTLFVSLGVPMLSGGDEVGRTQGGNNNGYCHDSELTWTPWAIPAEERAFSTFVQRLIALRAGQPVFQRRRFLSGRQATPGGQADVLWFRPDGREMTGEDWGNTDAQSIGVLFNGDAILEPDERGQPIVGDTLLILLNASAEDVPFVLPVRAGKAPWERLIDTADPTGPPAKRLVAGERWTVMARSSAVLRLAKRRK